MQIYILEPPRHRWMDQAIWSAVYFTSILYSVLLARIIPHTIEETTGAILAYVASLITVLGSLFCLAGVTFRRQGLELAGSWFILPSLLVYDGALWITSYLSPGPLLLSNSTPLAVLVLFTVLLYCGRILRLKITYRRNVEIAVLGERAVASNKELMGEE